MDSGLLIGATKLVAGLHSKEDNLLQFILNIKLPAEERVLYQFFGTMVIHIIYRVQYFTQKIFSRS